MKDNFSTGSADYAKYRPAYPESFFRYLDSVVPRKATAWDCATGNGQLAGALARTFDRVYATDISQSQLANAAARPNVEYSVQPAETTRFAAASFDLVTAGQAVHWFDFDRFYDEVRRTAKPDAIICLLGYGLLRISPAADAVIDHFYRDTVGPHWDPERKYIDENYRTLPFPFAELNPPAFTMQEEWTLDQLLGYLSTWSAVKHFRKAEGHDPVAELRDELQPHWPDGGSRTIRFPLLLRIGKLS